MRSINGLNILKQPDKINDKYDFHLVDDAISETFTTSTLTKNICFFKCGISKLILNKKIRILSIYILNKIICRYTWSPIYI